MNQPASLNMVAVVQRALEYNGTIFTSDGADDAFAMDASTGEVHWTYEPHLPPGPLEEIVGK